MSACQGLESAYCSGEDCPSDCSENAMIVDENDSIDDRQQSHTEVDVAIIGNGPSAIFLSLLLSGYLPYFDGHIQNKTLAAKLNEANGLSLIEQDLQYLSEGLEGRSKNPVALLFDTLFHPDADIGERYPSTLKWDHNPSKGCSHVVLGSGRPGGQWHTMDRNILTLSLCDWLGLPIFGFNDWKKEKKPEETTHRNDNVPSFYPPKEFAGLRAVAGDVAEYYEDYVEHMGLSANFKNGLTVEKVEIQHQHSNCKRPCKFPEEKGVVCPVIDKKYHRWVIRCKRSSSTEDEGRDPPSDEQIVVAKHLVLAGGLSHSISLGVPGEELDYVIDGVTFRQRVTNTKDQWRRRPVLVVGAGIAGADIALLCLREGIPCVHAFKQPPDDPGLMISKMLPGIYEEYHHLSLLMKGVKTSPHYTPLPQHVVTEFKPEGQCILMNLKDKTSVVLHDLSYAVVMIGCCGNLNFLHDEIKTHIVSDPSKPVHCKYNPLDVDLYSFRNEVYPNLYALGPLTGDNFVRFVLGSGLGCAQSILTQK